MDYKSRGLRRRGDSDKWEVTLSHKDPMSGEAVLSYHTVEGTSRKKAEKARDKLIRNLENKGAACTSQMTLGMFADKLEAPAFTMAFTVEQLRTTLAEAERREGLDASA